MSDVVNDLMNTIDELNIKNNDLERKLKEAMNKLNKIESVCDGYKDMQSEYETGTEIPYWDIMNIIKDQLEEQGE